MVARKAALRATATIANALSEYSPNRKAKNFTNNLFDATALQLPHGMERIHDILGAAQRFHAIATRRDAF
jgi:hypothetical protein